MRWRRYWRGNRNYACRLAAILNFAATGHQRAQPTCSRCFFLKTLTWPVIIPNFKKCHKVHDSCLLWHVPPPPLWTIMPVKMWHSTVVSWSGASKQWFTYAKQHMLRNAAKFLKNMHAHSAVFALYTAKSTKEEADRRTKSAPSSSPPSLLSSSSSLSHHFRS